MMRAKDPLVRSSMVTLLDARQSTRSFLEKPVSEQVLRSLLLEAGKAPSGGNLQPWKVYALCNSAKQKLTQAVSAKIAQGMTEDEPDIDVYPANLKSPYRDRRFNCGMALYDALDIAREDKAARSEQFAANFDFFSAPVGLIFTMDQQMGPAQFLDLGIYLQSLMLLAQERGLNSCPQLSWSLWSKTVREQLAITDDQAVIVGLALGYGDPAAEVNQYRTERADLEEYISLLGF